MSISRAKGLNSFQSSTRNYNFGWSLARFVFPKPLISCFSWRQNPAAFCTPLKWQEFCTLNRRPRIRYSTFQFFHHTQQTLWLLIEQRPISLASDSCSTSIYTVNKVFCSVVSVCSWGLATHDYHRIYGFQATTRLINSEIAHEHLG